MAYKILIVDDEPDWEIIILQKFQKQIQQGEWEFAFARNGLEALAALETIPGINIIVLDYKMPKMDGFTFLNKLNETDNSTIKTIVVTAFGDMDNIRKAMNAGAFDFLTKPIDFKDLEITIRKAFTQVAINKEALKARNELAAMNRELEIAAQIQYSMLPSQFPPFPQHTEFDIFAKMIPAKKIGGDFYDFFFIDNGKLAIAVGDVCGKGIPAALYMARTCIHLKSTAIKSFDPAKCLFELNNLLISEKRADDHFSVTLFYGILDINTGFMQYAYAGHPKPFIVYGDGKIDSIDRDPLGSLPLAYFENSEYDVKEIRLHKGDTIIVYTDGLTDAENAAGIQFNNDGENFKKSFAGANDMVPRDITEGFISKIEEFTAGVPQTDDITILALRYNERKG